MTAVHLYGVLTQGMELILEPDHMHLLPLTYAGGV